MRILKQKNRIGKERRGKEINEPDCKHTSRKERPRTTTNSESIRHNSFHEHISEGESPMTDHHHHPKKKKKNSKEKILLFPKERRENALDRFERFVGEKEGMEKRR